MKCGFSSVAPFSQLGRKAEYKNDGLKFDFLASYGARDPFRSGFFGEFINQRQRNRCPHFMGRSMQPLARCFKKSTDLLTWTKLKRPSVGVRRLPATW